MRLLKCSASMTLTIVELPRQAGRVLPPKPWQVALTLAGIVVTAILWSVS